MKNNILFIDSNKNTFEEYSSIFGEHCHKTNPATNDIPLSGSFSKSAFAHKPEPISFDLFFADNGQQGAKIVQAQLSAKNPIEVVFIEIGLSAQEDEVEILKLLKELDSNIEFVLVADTDLSVELNKLLKNASKVGNFSLLKKPFEPIELVQIAINQAEKNCLRKVKKDFMVNISHELVTPLTSIIGFLDLALYDTHMSDNIRQCLKLSLSNSELLKKLIEDLIQAASIQKNDLQYKFSAVSVNHLITEIAKTTQILRDKLSKNNIEIRCESLKEDQLIFCDPLRLKQLILNLSTNALKFTNKGLVSINASIHNDSIEFSVSDTGCGIKKDKLPQIFNQFFRSENNNHTIPGLGLGLFIAKEITERHRGEIKVESIYGKGSKFFLTMKLRGDLI